MFGVRSFIFQNFFPVKARAYPTFQSVTNPYSCTVAQRDILVISGQTIRLVYPLLTSPIVSGLDLLSRKEFISEFEFIEMQHKH